MTPPVDQPVGLIAGAGRIAYLAAEGIRKSNRPLVVVALRGAASIRLADLADDFTWVGIARIGRWIRALKKRGVRQAVMIGRVPKREIYRPMRIMRYIPDLRAIKIWYFRLRRDRRDNAILRAICDELAKEGIHLESSVKYCKEHLADEGVMTTCRISRSLEGDVEFGWRIARSCAEMDIGQSVAVKEQAIIAVEAIEGTDEMIRRAGNLCPSGGWTLVKVARPDQDMRFDVPAVGAETLRNLKDAGGRCLVLQAGKTLMVDKPVLIKIANKLKIPVIGKNYTSTQAKPESDSPGAVRGGRIR